MVRKISTLKSFYKFLIRYGYTQDNPVESIRLPKLAKKLPIFLSLTQMEKLLEFPFLNSVAGKRDRAILEILYGSGVRVGELASLQKEDVDLSHAMLKAKGKGKKERLVPLSNAAVQAIQEFWQSGLTINRKLCY